MQTFKQVARAGQFAAMQPAAVAKRNAERQGTNAPTFALAGELVNTVPQARRILIDAIRTDKAWLVPQAEAVIRTSDNGYNPAPVATLAVKFYLEHMDDTSGATYRAKCALEDLGVPKHVIDDCYFEQRHDEYVALNAINVRREYHTDPVEAFRFCEPKDRARLIRQRRLIPDDARERLSMYAPEPVAASVEVQP